MKKPQQELGLVHFLPFSFLSNFYHGPWAQLCRFVYKTFILSKTAKKIVSLFLLLTVCFVVASSHVCVPYSVNLHLVTCISIILFVKPATKFKVVAQPYSHVAFGVLFFKADVLFFVSIGL